MQAWPVAGWPLTSFGTEGVGNKILGILPFEKVKTIAHGKVITLE
jgi:hypothetical protein